MDPLFRSIFFNNVILETLTKHFDMKDIVNLANTCKIMHRVWVTRRGLHLERHLMQFFQWKPLAIGAFHTFRKRIFASLKFPGPCIGGCGQISCNADQCVPRHLCKYNLCTKCFVRFNQNDAYMDRKGYMLEDDALYQHKNILIENAKTEIDSDAVYDFFNTHTTSNDEYRNIYRIRHNFYIHFDRFNGYMKVKLDQIVHFATLHSAGIYSAICKHVKDRLDEAESKLETAKVIFNERKRIYDQLGEPNQVAKRR
jgi:hypothetical protein